MWTPTGRSLPSGSRACYRRTGWRSRSRACTSAAFPARTSDSHTVLEPCFCVIAQGAKTLTVGEDVLRYDPAHYAITTVGLPITAEIVEASRERPYLGLRLTLDPAVVASVMVESGVVQPRGDAGVRAVDVSQLDADLLDATVRLVRLSSGPASTAPSPRSSSARSSTAFGPGHRPAACGTSPRSAGKRTAWCERSRSSASISTSRCGSSRWRGAGHEPVRASTPISKP